MNLIRYPVDEHVSVLPLDYLSFATETNKLTNTFQFCSNLVAKLKLSIPITQKSKQKEQRSEGHFRREKALKPK